MSKITPTESQIQKTFIQYVRFKYPWLALRLVKIANEGKRSPREGKRLKDEGMLPGAFDLFIAYPKGEYCGLWLEFKSEGGRVSKEQREFYRLMTSDPIYYDAYIVWSIDEAIKRFEDYINERNFREDD